MQLSLTLARRDDPETSHKAAERAVTFKASHEGRIWGALEAAGAAELRRALNRVAELTAALKNAAFELEKISTWRDGAAEYDLECENPPRDFCEDVELIESAAKFAHEQAEEALKEPK